MPYSGDPGASTDDEVRFLLGDTDPARPRLTDPEVAFLVRKYVTAIRAAYQGALRLAAVYSGKANKSVGPTSIQYSGIADGYRATAADLKAQGGAAGTSGIVPLNLSAGGVDDDPWSDAEWQKQGWEE